MKNRNSSLPERDPRDFDLDVLLHPAQAFNHPDDVLSDPDLTRNEKRAILASWASDACAVEAAPALRQPPGGRGCVAVDDILMALRVLDHEAASVSPDPSWPRRQIRRRAIERFRRRRGNRPDNDLFN